MSSPEPRQSSARARAVAAAIRDKIAQHVVDAEQAYARKLGLDKPARRLDLRGDIVAAIRERPSDTAWPVRYAARRIAWHVLDHAWEIEDRRER